MSKEAMKLALEAFKKLSDYPHAFDECTNAIKALEEALAKQEQGEPDYWLGYGLQAHTEKPFEDATPIYTTPQPKQEQGEPVAWRDRKSGTLMHEKWLDADPLYTAPQQRTWVGLTELEAVEFVKTMERGNFLVAIYDIEKKLKEKNNA
jgi:hypothetical protein